MVVGLIYLRFLRHLPGETRRVFVIYRNAVHCGCGGHGDDWRTPFGTRITGGSWFAVLVTIEELLEMGSIVLFLHGVLRYVETTIGSVELRFGKIAAQAGTRPPR